MKNKWIGKVGEVWRCTSGSTAIYGLIIKKHDHGVHIYWLFETGPSVWGTHVGTVGLVTEPSWFTYSHTKKVI
jgi:hypothetical protein